MRGFQVTSDKFNGTANLLYSEEGLLCAINFTQCDMTADLITAFKRAVPAVYTIDAMKQAFSSGTTIVDAVLDVTFEMFWKKYDKKINRKRSEQVWNKMSKTDQVKAYYGIDAYFKYLKLEGWRTKLDPENYLKNRTWENEYR